MSFPSYPPYGAGWEKLAAASARANAPAFFIARQARSIARSQISQRPTQRTVPSPLNSARALANTIADGAEYAHHRGNDAEAVERLLDGLHLGRLVRQEPNALAQMVGLGIEAVALNAAYKVVPRLTLDGSAGGAPASPAQARGLIAAMLDERETRERFASALLRERIAVLNELDLHARETWAIRPLADRAALRWMRDFEIVMDACAAPNGAEARRIRASLPGDGWAPTLPMPFGDNDTAVGPRYSRWFDTYGPEGFGRMLETLYRVSAERRATALVVAARLYRHDHGRWPDAAAALVPAYLDAIPPDPFRADGGPIGYVLQRGALADGGDRPLVYFDLADAHPDDIDTEPMYDWQAGRPTNRRREIRQYRDVSYWTPKVRRFEEEQKALAQSGYRLYPGFPGYPGSSQAVDDEPDEPDTPGNDAEKSDAPDGPPEQ